MCLDPITFDEKIDLKLLQPHFYDVLSTLSARRSCPSRKREREIQGWNRIRHDNASTINRPILLWQAAKTRCTRRVPLGDPNFSQHLCLPKAFSGGQGRKEPFFFEESLTFLQDTRYIHIHTRPVASTFKGACFSTDVHHDKNTIRLFGWHNITGIWLWGCVGLGSCLVYWSRMQRHSNSRWSIHIKPNYTMRMNIRT